jgi:hypothetical protein
LTANPDFQTIEDEVLGLDFSYSERYLPDSRPFFSEGAGFLPPGQAFYSRRIETVDLGAKVFGSIGGTRFALLDTVGNWQSNDLAGRIRQTFNVADGQARLGLSFVNHHSEELTNTVAGSYAGYQRTSAKGAVYANASIFGSRTDGNMEDGYTYSFSIGRWVNAGIAGFFLYSGVEEDYNPYLGFVPEKDLRGPHVAIFYNSSKREGFLESWSLATNLQSFSRHNGELYYRTADSGASVSLDNELAMGVSAMWSDRPPNIDRLLGFNLSWKRDSRSWNGGIYTSFGEISGADYYLVGVNQTIQLLKPLIGKVSLQRRLLDFPHEEADRAIQLIASLNYDLSTERGIGGRMVYNEDGKLNPYVTFRQNVSKGLDAYLIVGEPNAPEFVRSIGFKCLYVF